MHEPLGEVVVVGAGVAGLAAATALAPRGRVVVIDRLPAAGGVLGYQHQVVRDLVRSSASAGAGMLLGTTALRWREQRLLTAGPAGVRWLDADHLVYAGGWRPATLAEQGIAGSRLAGVVPATVALHLMEGGVVLGRRVLVLGTGHWAQEVLAQVARQGSVSTHVDRAMAGWRPVSVDGLARVSSLTVERAGRRMRVPCDAVVVAGPQRPLRNVDGAVREPADAVTFIQPGEGVADAAAVADAAGRLAASVVAAPAVPPVVHPTHQESR